VNPPDSPILVIAAYSDTLPLTTVDDFADTVAGIPDDVLPRVFEPFFTTLPGFTGPPAGRCFFDADCLG
jgi:C4-dicarboxylate-specific signal transduction histidine kinase